MTGRERVVAALQGSPTDQAADLNRDAVITHPDDLAKWLDGALAAFVEVLSPFALSKSRGIDLSGILKGNPEEGFNQLDALKLEVSAALENAHAQRADGIFYHLDGPRASACTPMQYGGYYLELDRELLTQAKGLVLVYVPGEEPLYLDAISDLTAHAFGWNAAASGFSVDQFKALRGGITFGPDAEHDLHYTPVGLPSLTQVAR